MIKKILITSIMMFMCLSLSFADKLENVISIEDGQIEYYIFLKNLYDNPANYEWQKGIDGSGDEYVLAIENNSTFPNYYCFYNLSADSLNHEYDYFMGYALGLLRDSDGETTGSIKSEYIFANIANPDRDKYPYGDYIGNKYYFMNMQDIPYSKFNMVWLSGAFVMDY